MHFLGTCKQNATTHTVADPNLRVFVCVCVGPHPSGVKGSVRGGWTIGAHRQKVRWVKGSAETKEKMHCTERLLITSGRCIRGALPVGASSLRVRASGLPLGASDL